MKRASGSAAQEHHRHGGDHRDDRDGHLVGHADRRDDAVEGEHEVEQEDLANGGTEAQRSTGGVEEIVVRGRIDVVVDLCSGFPDQEEAASDEDQVAPRERMPEDREHGLGELDDDRDRAQES